MPDLRLVDITDPLLARCIAGAVAAWMTQGLCGEDGCKDCDCFGQVPHEARQVATAVLAALAEAGEPATVARALTEAQRDVVAWLEDHPDVPAGAIIRHVGPWRPTTGDPDA